jgi:hypothetical protein
MEYVMPNRPNDDEWVDVTPLPAGWPRPSAEDDEWAYFEPGQAPPEPRTLGGFARNVPRSAGRLVGGLAQAIASPVETVRGLVGIAGGAIQKPLPEGLRDKKLEAEWDTFVSLLKRRYGGVEELKTTLYEDPVGAAADVAGLLTGAGGALRTAGGAARLAGATRPAAALSGAGRALTGAAGAVDPIVGTARAGATVARGVQAVRGRMLPTLFGKAAGTGPRPIEVARSLQRGTPQYEAFKQAMRGGFSEHEVLANFRGALDRAKEIRGAEYRAKLAEVTRQTQELDIRPIKVELAEQLQRYGVRASLDAKGRVKGLDFSRSTISDAAEQTRVKSLVQDVQDWGSRPGDLSPAGVDILKRRLDGFYSPSSDVRAMVARVRARTNHTLRKGVPGYEEMSRGYAEVSELIENVERGLSLGGQHGQTAIRKLQQALKENKNYQAALVESLEQYVADPTLTAQLAGYSMRTWTPHGIVGSLSAAGLIHGLVLGKISPKLIISMASHSPRAMGELFLAMSAMQDAVRGATAPLRVAPGSYRALQAPGAVREAQAEDADEWLYQDGDEWVDLDVYEARQAAERGQ